MQRLLSYPQAIIALYILLMIAGILGFKTLPLKLFPDTNRPVISLIVQWPGAAASDVARDVTHPMEVRMYAIDGVRKITSTSRDEVSAVKIEFEYGINIEDAATRVNTELPRVAGSLPAGTRAPIILKITDAARPVSVLAVTAAKGYHLDLGQIRRIAANPLRDAVLRIPSVAEAEVFGGDRRQVEVMLDRDRLEAHNASVAGVSTAIAKSNLSIPAGLVHREGQRLLITVRHLAQLPDDIGNILVPMKGGSYVRVRDLGKVDWRGADPTSLYYGNGREAVALSLLRSQEGDTSDVINKINKALPLLQAEFPMLDIAVADSQERLINLTVGTMLDSLRDAVIMTLLVILLFLGNSRAAFITALSIPFTYLITFAALKFIGYEFNMVTLTAVIIAVGLLADDAIVVIENIERRMRQTGEDGASAAARGTSEIFLADASGTVTTIAVLVPIMFIGGFVETVLRPLTVTLSIALAASLLVSVTIIPLMVPWLLKPGRKDPLAFILEPFARFVIDPLRRFFVALLEWGLDRPATLLLSFALLFALALPQIPILGRELMPVMDTGVSQISFEAAPDTDVKQMKTIVGKIQKVIHDEIPQDWIVSSSTVVGAEPAVKSFGAERLFSQGLITLNLVNRHKRDKSIYDIERTLRYKLHAIPGLISVNVYEFGATPLSSIRGTVDVMIAGPDGRILDRLADDVLSRLEKVRGLTGAERSWQGHSSRVNLNVDPAKARLYGLTAQDVAKQVAAEIKGIPGGTLRVAGENSIAVWLRFTPAQRSNIEAIKALQIRTADGRNLPLALIASPQIYSGAAAETHQALRPTVDVIGYRNNIAVTHLHENVVAALQGLEIPRGYKLSYEGEVRQSLESFTRLRASFGLGLVFLFIMLIVTFRSFLDPIAVMASLPLAVIGAVFAMLLAGKHGSMPSFMGLILLMSIAVNNGILLIDFAKQARKAGKSLHDAVIQAVELRTRPILMTAGASSVGMVPIAFEWSIGIERLSPLAVVAIGGLVAGTFLTLVAVPVIYYLLERAREDLAARFSMAGSGKGA